MAKLQRKPAHSASCLAWLSVKFTSDFGPADRRKLSTRMNRSLARAGIRAFVLPSLIGLMRRPVGVIPDEASLITAWLATQPGVQTVDRLTPIPSVLLKGVRHD